MKEFNRDDYNALKSSNLVKGLANSEQLRFDSVESATVFFARELDQVKAKTYDKLYPELSALAYFPITSEVNEGAETTTYYSYDITGMAAIRQRNVMILVIWKGPRLQRLPSQNIRQSRKLSWLQKRRKRLKSKL